MGKMWLFDWLSILLPELWSLKCHFYVFCADDAKKIVTVWAKYLSAFK